MTIRRQRFFPTLAVVAMLLIGFQNCSSVFHPRSKNENDLASSPSASSPGQQISLPAAAPATQQLKEVSWFLSNHQSVKADYFQGKFGVYENPTGWTEGWLLRSYINMYEGSHDIAILRALNELLEIVAAGNDELIGYKDDIRGQVMPGWGNTYGGLFGGKRYVDFGNAGLYMYPMAAFARIVKSNIGLQSEFGSDADRYLAQIDDIVLANEPWRNHEGPYSDGSYGDYYVYPSGYMENGVDYSLQAVPLNVTLIPVEAIAEAYRAQGNSDYATHATNVSNFFWWHTTYESVGGVTSLIWDYWPRHSGGQTEDPSHGAADVLFAKTLFESGIQTPWNDGRLQYLANTFTQTLMNGSYAMNKYIDGTGGVIPLASNSICSDWVSLRPYDINQDLTTDIYYDCRQILDASNIKPTDQMPVFASFFRFNPNPSDRWLLKYIP